MTQGGLFGEPDDKLTRDFLRFHEANPSVYQLFKRFTHQAVDAGRRHYGARTIIHRIRWHVEVETRGDAFKVNNNWSPFYARLYMNEHPQHEGFFRTRAATADSMVPEGA